MIVIDIVAVGVVTSALLDARDSGLRAKQNVLELDFESAQENLLSTQKSFSKAERGFHFLKPLFYFPWVGDQFAAVHQMSLLGEDLTTMFLELTEVGGDVGRLAGLGPDEMFTTFQILSPETKSLVLKRFAAAAPDFVSAQTTVRLILQQIDELDLDYGSTRFTEWFLPVEAQMHEWQDALETLTFLSVVIPEFAGIDEEQQFLLLFLNNAEMRPGGGFIGTYGVLRMQDGDIKSLNTKDSYLLDNAAEPYFDQPPPFPLARYNETNKWFLRDSNWSPDFAVSSQHSIAAFYREVDVLPDEIQSEIQDPVVFDGVIGFTPDFASSLLEIIGPVSVDGQLFTPENVPDMLEYQVERGFVQKGIPEAQRKEILASLVEEVKEKLFSIEPDKWIDVFARVKESLRTKQLVVYSADQEAEDVIAKVNWGGRFFPGPVDTFFVVDANLASLKSDPVVQRTIGYEINQNDFGDWVAELSIVYDHEGAFDWKTTRYRDYVRIYVPQGSELIDLTGSLANDRLKNPGLLPGDVSVTNELGMTVFGAFISVEPGDSRTLSVTYELPKVIAESIDQGKYQLDVLKQIGAQEAALTLDLDFDKNIRSATPAEVSDKWGDGSYTLNTKLDQDLKFEVTF